MGLGRGGKKIKRKETKTESPCCVPDTGENIEYRGPVVETHLVCSRDLRKPILLEWVGQDGEC